MFVKGDKYFRTGDLISRDAQGYFRFVDRIGDTFRYGEGQRARVNGHKPRGHLPPSGT